MVGIQGDTLPQPASKKAQGEWGEGRGRGGNVEGRTNRGGRREVGKRGRRGYITATLTPGAVHSI